MKIKKTIIVLLFFCIFFNNIYARTKIMFEDLFEAENILKVSKEILDVPLKDLSVAYLSNKDCRLLRNSIFFYHGHDFKSKDLIEYFSKNYERKSNEKTSLSDIDTNNVDLILLYEKRGEIKSEGELKKNKLSSDYLGDWYLEAYGAGKDDCACLSIKNDGTFVFSPNYNGNSSCLKNFSGKIYVHNKTLYLYINKIVLSEKRNFDYIKSAPEYDSKTGNYKLSLDKPVILSFPVTVPERSTAKMISPGYIEEEYSVNSYIHMTLGTLLFFRNE